ncbi:hypothetical protein [Paraburkholderia bryophila]|uniref:Uncharacterized protein n=1 Tax=Paraburkholderia bryophila TaxID=420952 RepID=A0A7Y9W3I0_9BURK|nr:hypothetical protein [Paraburkholderia bryophila]NYH13559.1 hypothetical protein [Paraburkholderia bryophila]
MTAQNPMTRAQFEAVANEFRVPVQVAGLRVGIIDKYVADSATPLDLRKGLTRALQATLPKSVPLSIRGDATCFTGDMFGPHEQKVRAAVIEAAHQSPVLRQVVEVDRSGRETTSFYGQKRSWMAAYSGPVQRMTKIDGQPVKIPLVL